MRDPVLLPTSGNVCDSSSMKRILLNDEHDPFNRAPLRMMDLVPQVELKARIERWIEQKLRGEETDEDRRKRGEDQQMSCEDYSPELFSQEQLLELKKGKSDVLSPGLMLS